MPRIFEQKKSKILEQLSTSDAEYTDLSPKGSVDDGIKKLCDEINTNEGYVTTSSCAGRVAVFLDGGSTTGAEGEMSSQGGKGGGRWLFVSHDPVDMSDLRKDGDIWSLFNIARHKQIGVPPPDTAVRLVHFRFEPMILHILTSSLPEAQHAHAAAMSAGFRESGISGITGSEPTPLVAVRTQGLALACVIAYQDPSGTIVPMVSEEYMRTILHVANQRFTINTARKERFRQALLRISDDHKQDDWEPADARRDRKRAEGLLRQSMKRQECNAKSQARESDHSNQMGQPSSDEDK